MIRFRSGAAPALLALALLLPTAPASAGIPLAVGADDRGMPTLAPLLEQVTPGVVNIAVQGRVATQRNPLFDDPFFRRFFNVPQQPTERKFRAAGSGVIVDAEKGYILTNNHVIANADKVTVTLRDGRKLEAKVVGADPEVDIAVIQVPAENLTAVPMGDSENLKVGDFVIAIGNPFGIGQTVTSGIVSALGRSGLGIEGYEDFIQTDASINPGNSGGALVDLKGQLIGVNTAIVGPGGGNVGIGFAIPINMARSIMEQLIATGEVRRGQLGVHIQNLTPDIAAALGVDAKRGAVVAQVGKGSPAAKAGIEAGDVIVAVNDEPVENASDLRNKIGLMPIDKPVTLEVLRGGDRRTVTVRLAPRATATASANDIDPRLAGAEFGPIQPGTPGYGQIEGVQVRGIAKGSPAWNAGLRPGDIIGSVNRMRVRSPAKFAEAVRQVKGPLLLNIRRGDAALFLVIR